jgi:cardiolipin synthase A/B
LINAAQHTLDIEQLEFAYYWRGSNSTSSAASSVSPVVAAVIAAAQRGVQVRVLVNPDSTSGNTTANPPATASQGTNAQAVSLLNGLAQSGNLQMVARIADVNAMGVEYIHNKGIIVDGQITLISSINWSQNAIQNNREAAVALTSPSLTSYYEAAFTQDWNQSAN